MFLSLLSTKFSNKRVKWSSPSEVWAFPPSHPSLPEPAPAAPVWIDCSLGLLYRGQPQFSVHHDSRSSLLFSSLFSSSNILFLFGLFIFFFPIASPEKGLLGDKFAVTLHVWKCMSSIFTLINRCVQCCAWASIKFWTRWLFFRISKALLHCLLIFPF